MFFMSRCSIQPEVRMGVLTYKRIAGVPMKRDYRVIMHKDKSFSGAMRPFLQLLNIKNTCRE